MAVETIGADTASSRGTTITPSATAHTKGSWTQLVASSTANARGILVVLSGISTSSTEDYLVDIGTGAAASETAVISNLPHAGPTARVLSAYYIPLPISNGTRISARCQCGATSGGGIAVMAYLLPLQTVDLQDVTNVTTYGAVTGTTRGTSIDPGGTANTKGTWTEISASTSRDIDWIIPMADNLGDTNQSVAEWLVDLGTGASSSEVAFLSNVQFQSTGVTDLKVPQSYPAIPIPRITSGTRLSARAQCNINTAGDRLLGVILVGCDGTSTDTVTGIGTLVGGGLVH